MRELPIPFIQSWMYSFICPILARWKVKEEATQVARKGFQTSKENKKYPTLPVSLLL